MRKALPRLELHAVRVPDRADAGEARRGELDLGILALPVDSEGLEARELYEEPSWWLFRSSIARQAIASGWTI